MENKELSKLVKKRIELNVVENVLNRLDYDLSNLNEKLDSYYIEFKENSEDDYCKERLTELNYEKEYLNSLIQMIEKQI